MRGGEYNGGRGKRLGRRWEVGKRGREEEGKKGKRGKGREEKRKRERG